MAHISPAETCLADLPKTICRLLTRRPARLPQVNGVGGASNERESLGRNGLPAGHAYQAVTKSCRRLDRAARARRASAGHGAP